MIVSARLLSSNLSRTFNVALHSLIELHDYLIPVATRQVGEGGDGGGPTKPPQQALLSLSQLHEGYGHIGHAMEALMEAVDVDQGSGDGESLVTCLMQLCALMRAAPPSESAHSKSPAAMMQVRAPSLSCRSRITPSMHVLQGANSSALGIIFTLLMYFGVRVLNMHPYHPTFYPLKLAAAWNSV